MINARARGKSMDFYLRTHKPVVVVAEGHSSPSGAPTEQTIETSVSPSSQETVFSPTTTRNPRPVGPCAPWAPWRAGGPLRARIALCPSWANRTLCAWGCLLDPVAQAALAFVRSQPAPRSKAQQSKELPSWISPS